MFFILKVVISLTVYLRSIVICKIIDILFRAIFNQYSSMDVDNNLPKVFLGLCSASLAYWVYKQYKSYRKHNNKTKKISQQTPIDVSSFKQMKKKKGDIVILRVVPEIQEPKSQKYDYFSNHKDFFFPNERLYVQNKLIKQRDRNSRKKWKGRDIYQPENFIQLKGLGKICSGMLEVDVKAIQIQQNHSIFGLIYQKLMTISQWILQVCSIILYGMDRRILVPYFRGIKIGEFHVNYNWFKDSILVSCQINNDLHPIVKAIALTQSDLINDNQSELDMPSYKLILVTMFSGILMYSCYLVYKFIKKKLKKMREDRMIPFGSKQLLFQPDNQTQTCIICLQNNRSIVFHRCRHLALCVACLYTIQKIQCPTCKTPFEATKIYSLN